MKITDLSVSFGDKRIFEDFSYEFEASTLTTILGDSGIGKTTLLNSIAGLVEHTGKIEDCGVVSYMFQEPRLIDTATVRENLLYVRGGKRAGAEVEKEIIDLLGIVGLSSEINTPVSALSGGMQSRVALARAFLYPSDILLMDEPFKSLDIALSSRLRKNLVDLLAVRPRTVLLVTHDIDEAVELGDSVLVLSGRPARAVFSAKKGDFDRKKLIEILTDQSKS